MWAELVVMSPPVLDDNPGLFQGKEDLAIEQFIPKLRVEVFAIAILPGAARFDVGGPGPNSRDPILDGSGDETRAVIGTDIARRAPQDEQVGQHVDHRGRVQLAINADRQTLPRELIDDVDHAVFETVIRAVFDKIV